MHSNRVPGSFVFKENFARFFSFCLAESAGILDAAERKISLQK
jgi:hypothetical protein